MSAAEHDFTVYSYPQLGFELIWDEALGEFVRIPL